MTKNACVIVAMLSLIILGCSTPDSRDVHANRQTPSSETTGQRLVLQCLEEDVQASQQFETELAALVEALRQSEDRQADLLALLGDRVAQAGVLMACLQSIDIAIDLTLENLRHAQTHGYKQVCAEFVGEKVVEVRRRFTQGVLQHTDAPLDLAIQGPGFFSVTLHDGDIRYTRYGHFYLDLNGEMKLMPGYPLTDLSGLPVGLSPITVDQDGTVRGMTAQGISVNIGRIKLVIFPHPEGLRLVDDILYEESEASGPAVLVTPGEQGTGILKQGYLEKSNVELTEELHTLHTLQVWKRGLKRAVVLLDKPVEQ